MGIYDRDYYRREGPSFLGSFANRGQVCKWLVMINIIVFILQLLTLPHGQGGGQGVGLFTQTFELNPSEVLSGKVWQLLTYAFLHSPGNPLHIIFNMLLLWWFGHAVEELYGHGEFLAFYLIAALLGGLAFVGTGLVGLTDLGVPCLGASGAVMAVMMVYAFHYPRYTVLLFFVLPVPIWALVCFVVVIDAFGLLSGTSGGTAVSVHLAGAAFGALYYQSHIRLLNLWPKFKFRSRQRARPRLRVFREEEAETPQPVPVAAPPAPDLDEQLEAKVDAVLEKVARSGQASLTESERQILLRASEIYKKRRS
jgi:membrane associated rhomboid family serine protease